MQSKGPCLALALLYVVLAGAAGAQGDASDGSSGTTVTDLEARRAAVEADTSLSEEARTRALELLSRALEERRQAAGLAEQKAALVARIEAAPARIRELEAQLAEPPPARPDLSGVALEDLERRAKERQQELDAAREELKARERGLAALSARGPGLSELISERRLTLRRLADDGAKPPPDEPPAVASAREAYLAAREARLAAEIEKAEEELARYELLVRLATIERDAAAARVARLDTTLEALVSALEARRAQAVREGRREAEVTKAEAAGLPEAVAALAAENAALREELEQITLATGRVSEQLRDAQRRASELESDLISIRERVETVGATEAVGRLLRRRLASLREIETDRLSAFSRANEIVRATDRRIDLGEKRRELALPGEEVDKLLERIPPEVRAEFQEGALREQVQALVSAERTTIDELYDAYGRYITQLTSYDTAERQLSTTAEAMRSFIRRELLWTRSLPVLSPADFATKVSLLAELLSTQHWQRLVADAKAAVAANPARVGAGLLALLALLGGRPWARRQLAALGERVSRIRTDAFRHTVLALLLTGLIAAAWPVLTALAGLLLAAAPDPAPFTRQVSVTLRQLASLLAIFATVRWLIHYDGLARRHFRWPEPVRVMLRREFQWLTPLAIVCVVLGVYGSALGTDEAQRALARPALMVFAAALAVLFYRMFRRSSALTEVMFRRQGEGFAARCWRFWFPLLVAGPAVNVVAAAAGYIDAARTATVLIIDTGWLVIGVWVLRDVMLRWFTISERRLRFEQAIKQREEARAEREKQQQEGEEPPASETAEVEVPEVDFRELGEQGRAVVRAAVLVGVVLGLVRLWSDLLPALDVLDRFELPMTRALVVDGVERRVPVTGTHLALALLVLGATFFAARNLSGLLGFTLLRRVAGDAGAQYAIVTLCQYALVAAGLLYAFAAIGVEWSKLQWLVAALGVGLGFGLQEIVANFVSGIILLLERPVRVGDVVTVGDATGTVARIRIRATTIVDWDRKELVVPNKEFVTGRLLNWTLSNDTLRLVVPVGVAYGSDARRARELLLEAASENEHVLEDPAPIVLFNSFGDNALGLELRAYLPSITHLLTVQTELHDAIYEKFAAAGIVISFPQRDVHLDTTAPLDIRVHAASAAAHAERRPWRRARRGR